MARINLLPWREQRRKEQQRRFLSMLGLTAVLGLAVLVGAHLYISGLIDNQNMRLNRLRQEIRVVDRQIREIRDLDKAKRALMDRMEIVQQLQRSRPEIVHIFDELVTTLPDGAYLTEVIQQGNTLKISGKAESDARVSNYMRNLERSPWLKNPKLSVIQSRAKSNKSRTTVRSFSLQVEKETPRQQEGKRGSE